MDTAKVMVIDDEPAVVSALTRLLNSAGFDAHGVQSSDEIIAENRLGEVDCILMDLNMPGTSGIELQKILTNAECRCPIIFISGEADVESSVSAMKAGAVDFLTKPIDEEKLFLAINTALVQLQRRRVEYNEIASLRERFASLTPRERQVFDAVAAGFLNKQIAANFGTAEKTIKVQRARVMQKMDARTFAELVRMAAKLCH